MPRFVMELLRDNNVRHLYAQKEQINLDPPYQRLSVWDTEKRQRFIDSVINEIDTPKIYFHDLAGQSISSPGLRFSVIDGKQRMLALWEFMANELPLRPDFVYLHDESLNGAGYTYEQLLRKSPILRSKFDNFKVPVISVKAEGEEFIEQLFYRLNIQVPLSAPEHRNMMGGPIPLLIRKIGFTPFFGESVQFSNQRFQHLNLAAKFLLISYANDFVSTKKGDLDDFVIRMKSDREQEKEVASPQALGDLENRTRTELDRLHAFFGRQNPLLRSVGRVTLYFHIFRVCSSTGHEFPLSMPMLEQFNEDVTHARQKSQTLALESGAPLNETESNLVRFDVEKQSPNDEGAVKRQYGYLRKYMADKYSAELPDLV